MQSEAEPIPFKLIWNLSLCIHIEMIKLELNAGVLVAIINFDDTKDDKSWPGPAPLEKVSEKGEEKKKRKSKKKTDG